MKISEVIKELEIMLEDCGDLPLYIWSDGADFDIHAICHDQAIKAVSICATTFSIDVKK